MAIYHQIIPVELVEQYADRDQRYQQHPEEFINFLSHLPEPASVLAAVKAKSDKYPDEFRSVLVEVLKEQHQLLNLDIPQVHDQIQRLQSDQTYAVVTAHQTCLMTGPLYVIYKIASTIACCRQLNAIHSDKHFVPIYVMGSEDHDFLEVNHFYLYNKKIEWHVTHQGEAVGRIQIKDIEEVMDNVDQIIQHDVHAEELMDLLRSCYSEGRNLAQAMARLVTRIFGRYGLIVADLDDQRLKRLAIPLFHKELEESSSKELVINKQNAIDILGFSSQVYPRDINLFYLKDTRKKIERFNDKYYLGEQALSFDKVIEHLHNHPERFSPNVILRPIYQQIVLPGIIYIGGGAEVAYWMEIQDVFQTMKIPQPILLRRDSALWINQLHSQRISELGIELRQLFRPLHEAQHEYLSKNAQEEWSVAHIKSQFNDLFSQLSGEIRQIDTGLIKMSEGYQRQTDNFLNKVETKLRRSVKSKHDVAMGRMDKLWHDLFPNRGLQERRENFLKLYARHGRHFIDTLIDHFNPFDMRGMHVFIESGES